MAAPARLPALSVDGPAGASDPLLSRTRWQ